jgi:hypothetical protein
MEAQISNTSVLPNEAATEALAPVPPPLEQAPVDPGPQGWNPPGGSEDFDALFQRNGIDGESLVNSNTIPTEPTTETEEPAVQATPAPPEPAKFELKTATGTVYKTQEDAIKGIEQKDQLINQLRSMVAAATGEDPLSKSGAKPAPTTPGKAPVSYLQDSTRYATDLQAAAEHGQKTGDWNPYRNVAAQLQYEVVQSAIGPYMPVVQNVGKQQAMESVSKDIPEFRNFYGSTDYQKVLESRPKLANYIQQLEGNPTMQEDLAEIYHNVWDASQVKKLAEAVSKPTPPPQNPTPRMPTQPKMPTFKSEPNDGMRRSTPAQAKPTLATSEGRRLLIEELERKGLADVNF